MAQFLEHPQIILCGPFPPKVLDNVASPVSAVGLSQVRISQARNGGDKLGHIFGFNADSSLSSPYDLPRLAINRKYQRTTAGHKLQHLGGNDGLEQISLL